MSDETPQRKTCTKCGVEKTLDEFSRQASGKLGRKRHCKSCSAEYDRERYTKNRDRILEQKREYREANSERLAERNREYRDANSGRIAEKNRKYRDANRDRINEKMRDYYQQNRNRIAERDRKYREVNRHRIAEQRRANRTYHTSLQARRRARKKSLPFETVLPRDVAIRDGAWCWMCGDELSDYDPAHLDHLIPVAADPEELERWNVVNPGTVHANMCLACPGCNYRKSNRIMLCAVARYLVNFNAESEIAA